MPGHMLYAASHTSTRKPVENGPAERCNTHRFRSERAISDHIVRTRLAHVERRMAVHGDTSGRQFQPKGLGIEAGGLNGAGGREIIKGIERGAGRKGRPVRRSQPRHPPPFLVDAHEQAVTAMNFAKAIRERAKLSGILAIAPEQDVTDWLGIAKERALVRGQDGSG